MYLIKSDLFRKMPNKQKEMLNFRLCRRLICDDVGLKHNFFQSLSKQEIFMVKKKYIYLRIFMIFKCLQNYLSNKLTFVKNRAP